MSSKSIVFVDSRVANYQSLIDSLNEPYEVFILDGDKDGLDQMAGYLSGRSGLDAIHVISHGSQGALYLGSTVLDSSNLSAYGAQLGKVGSSLTQTGDILLYGCNVAQGAEGADFVRMLTNFTGADVAASNDLTGPRQLGGNGELETTSGVIEAALLSMTSLGETLAVNNAPTFSGLFGRVITDFGRNDVGFSVIQQADGKLVVAGNSEYDLALARYNSDGTLDTSFDGNGRLTNNSGNLVSSPSVIQQADGKVVALGASWGEHVLVRYNADGTLDTSFDGDGQRNIYMAGYIVTQQADGTLIVAGTMGGNFSLQRYNADGTIESIQTADYVGYELSVIQQADGKLVVRGASDGHSILARYNADGTLDTSFDGDGKVSTDFTGYDVIQQADGKLVMAGTSDGNFALVRYNADGTLDTSFDGDGMVTTDFGYSFYDFSYSVIQQADGKLVAAGSSGDNFALARYNADGTLDTSFDGDGMVTTDFGYSFYDSSYSVIQQADGRLVAAGTSGGNFALARYNTDGTLDSTFSAPENTFDQHPTFIEDQYDYYWYADFVLLAPRGHIFDAELSASGHYSGASLTLSRHGGASADDILAGTGTLSTLTTGNYFSVDGVTIGRVTANAGGTLQLSFNSNATQALIDAALQQIGYANTSDAPPPTVQMDWVFGDGNTGAQGTGGAKSVTGGTTVSITPTNDAPVSAHLLQYLAVATDVPFTYTLPSGAFTDPDLETITYSVSMSNGSGTPPWLIINPSTGALSGTPDSLDVGVFGVRITARDSSGSTASDDFQLTVSTPSLVRDGTEGNDNLVTGGGNDVLNGLAGNDTLDGGAGNDNMLGGNGSDLYHVRDVGDIITETNASVSTGGTDTVYSYINAYTLTVNVENARIMASTAADLNGNSLANLLYTGEGDNIIDGDTGTDTVSYLYATAGVTVNLSSLIAQDTEGSGIDTLRNIENINGSKFDDTLTGNSSANVINGGTGADLLVGRDGSDTYYVDNIGDVVVETNAMTASGGTDHVHSYLAAYSLGANVENGRILSTSTASLTGNTLNNLLYAGAGNNIIDGGSGIDTVSYLYGLATGSTTGITANLQNGQVAGSSGADTLISIENITGSSLNDNLIGTTGNNILDGGSGSDTMAGGAGDDTYVVNSSLDAVTENVNEGTDTVNTLASSFTLGLNIENARIIATGTASLTGNDLDNLVYAGAGNNVIDGGTGTDTVFYTDAGAGVTANLAQATAQVTGGSGSDTLKNIENITGSAYADNLTGGAAANVIDGGAGIDNMTGGDGNDTFYVRNVGDAVIETDTITAGIDTVYSYIASYTLHDNVENAQIKSTGAANLTGNVLNNSLTGNADANTLDGGAGSDTLNGSTGADNMTGGDGSDTYYVDNTGDKVVETNATSTGGTDTVISTITHVLAANVENLTLSGAATISATGNALANTLVGNSAANILTGGAGADNLNGGTGADTLVLNAVVGTSSDSSRTVVTGLNNDKGQDTLTAFSLTEDTIKVVATNVASFVHGTDTTIGAGTGTDVTGQRSSFSKATGLIELNQTTNNNWADAGDIAVTFATPSMTLTETNFEARLQYSLTGTSAANTLTGGRLKDVLSGGSGNDNLNGAAGADKLTGGMGADKFIFSLAKDTGITRTTWDTITDFSSAQLDKIDLSALDANTATGENDAFSTVVVGGVFSGAFASPGDLYFDSVNHVLYGNTDADTSAEFAIALTGVTSLVAADFML